MEAREILEPLELHYSDLLSLSSDDFLLSLSSSSRAESERLEALTTAIIENLGPNGPGLLAITGVPNASNLRSILLPLARDLALLDNDDRKRILKEHSLGSDVPLKNLDRRVSSFAMQLKYHQNLDSSTPNVVSLKGDDIDSTTKDYLAVDRVSISPENKFRNLGSSFRELGFCMMDLGLCLARICDRAIGGHELEQSLLESGTAKGRLIHYHSALDSFVIKESLRRKGSRKGHSNLRSPHVRFVSKECSKRNEFISQNGSEVRSSEKHSDLWQQWHYDYGIFTVLTSPMFILPCSCQTVNTNNCCQKCQNKECPSPGGHSYLQIFDANKNEIHIIKAPPESFIIQVGESADVLSKGKLHSTLHSVCKPVEPENLSRETFVVFLQPAWNKIFDISDYPVELLTSNGHHSKINKEEPQCDQLELKKVTQEIHRIVPPLLLRIKNGMTFAEFSRETTKQYYGGTGLQSNR